MTESPLSKSVENRSDVTQTSPRLDRCNVCRRVEGDAAHPVELDNKMPIFTTQSKGGIAMAPGLGVHLDAHFGSTRNGRRNVFDSRRYGNCNRSVPEPLVEWVYVVSPVS